MDKRLQRHLFWSFALSLAALVSLWCVCITIWPSHKPVEYPSYVHRTLYVDRRFNEEEMLLISWAAIRWSETTNHIIDYDVVRLPITKHKEWAQPDDIIVLDLSPDYPEVIRLDQDNQDMTLGYFNPYGQDHTIGIVEERFDDTPQGIDDFEEVMMHELGHSVGLKHNDGEFGIGTLMFPSIDLGADYITQDDLVNFCKLYKCNPNELQHEEEPFHF